jgi:hypothetical protein
MIEVSRSVVIARPAKEVAAQFADVGHHERTNVHRGVTFRVLAENDAWCEYEQLSKLLGRTVQQRMTLDRRDRRHLINTVTAGRFSGGTLRFDIAPRASMSTEVTATLRAPSSVLTKPLTPLLRIALGRSLASALAEDKTDLEERRYQPLAP